MSNPRFLEIILMVSLLFVVVKTSQAQTDLALGKSIYVWDFVPPASNDTAFKTQTKSFTNEFEAALIKTGKFTVIQRRDRTRIVKQLENERQIMGIKNFSKAEIEKLSRDLKVDAVIFGEITDDFDSGQLQIRVSAESFDERILLQESILFPRGLRQNLQTRQDSMRALVKKIVPHPNPRPLPENPKPEEPPVEPPSTEVNKFVFALKSCKLSGRNLTCTLLVTNKGEDRELHIDIGDTRIFDPDGNEYIAKSANIGARDRVARIVSGTPVKLSMDFGAITTEFKKVNLFEIKIYLTGAGAGYYFPQLRNFSVEK